MFHPSVPLRDRLQPHLSRLCVGPVVIHCALEKKNHGYGPDAGQTSRLSVSGAKRSALIDFPPQVLFPQACISRTHAAPQHDKTNSDHPVKPCWKNRPTLKLWREFSPDSERERSDHSTLAPSRFSAKSPQILGNFRARPGLRPCLRKGKWCRKGDRESERLWGFTAWYP